MKKLIPELRRSGLIPSTAKTIKIDSSMSRIIQDLTCHEYTKATAFDFERMDALRLHLIEAATAALSKSALAVQFEAPMNVEFVCCCLNSKSGIRFEFFDSDGYIDAVEMDAHGQLTGLHYYLVYCRQCLIAAAALESKTPFIYDDVEFELKMRSEFAQAVEGDIFYFDRLFEQQSAGEATRSFADFIMFSASSQVRLYEVGITSCFVPDAVSHLSNISRATKFAADDAFLDRVESLAEKPELIEKAGLLARSPGDHIWIEMPHPHYDDGVIGFYVEADGLGGRMARVQCFERWDGVRPDVFRVNEFEVDLENRNAANQLSGLLIAAFALLGASGVFKLRQVDPETDRTHHRINRRLEKMGIPNSPYVLVECIVDIDREDGEGRFKEAATWFQARRRRHRVRGFWRWRLAKLEFVREHFRGSEDLGTIEKRYRLTSSANT